MGNRLKYYVRKAKNLPPKIVIRKVCRKVIRKGLGTIDKVMANAFGAEMTDVEFLKGVWSSDYQFKNSEELQKHFCGGKEPKFFIDSLKREDVASLIHEHFPSIPDKIIAGADKICEHIFDLLGSGPVKVHYGMKAKGFEGHCYDMKINSDKAHSSSFIGQKKALSAISHEPIDWHIDFKSGYRWNPRTYYKDIKYGHRAGVDVRVPWELSRFQHLTTLGEAYFLSNDEKYVKEFINQVTDWIEHNPPKFGVNWVCTMDVAIRACNWLLAWEFFEDSPSISNEFIIRFFKSLLYHGRHIRSNLERSDTFTSNHYLSDIVGLVHLGVLIPEFKGSKEWKNFGIKELKKEMEKQVYSDGVDFEASTCYHRLVLELFFYATLPVIINDKNFEKDNFIEVGNEIFGEEYLQRLYKMFEFVLYALKPNGRMPQIGDNDNGRLHIFTNREVLDMRYLPTFGAIFFKEPKFKVKEFGFCEEALWVFGKEGYKIWQDLKENCLANIGSKAFPNAGWYIMRNDKDDMIISCGPNGQNGNGGHCHNDKLSFELCIDGEDIIVDPGTYIYTAEPEWRNKFRSTAYHNTVVVDGREQNRFDEDNLFGVTNDAQVKVNKWETNNEYDFLDAQHSGYERLSEPVIHGRQILFNKKEGYWVIKDNLTGVGKHAFNLYFHFTAMEVIVHAKNPLGTRGTTKNGANIAVIPMGGDEGLKVSIEKTWLSYSYGEKIKGSAVKYSKSANAPVEFMTVISLFGDFKSLSEAENIKKKVRLLLSGKSLA